MRVGSELVLGLVVGEYVSNPLFFFNDTATTEIYTLSLHDALPISSTRRPFVAGASPPRSTASRGRLRPGTPGAIRDPARRAGGLARGSRRRAPGESGGCRGARSWWESDRRGGLRASRAHERPNHRRHSDRSERRPPVRPGAGR